MIRDLARRLDRLEAGRKRLHKPLENLLCAARRWNVDEKKLLNTLKGHEWEILSQVGDSYTGTVTWSVFQFLATVNHPEPEPDKGGQTAADCLP